MSAIKGPLLCYARGDTAPLSLKFSQAGAATDFTGYTSIILTVTSVEDPPDGLSKLFSMEGFISATQGQLDFRPEGINEPARLAESEAYSPDVVDSVEKFYDVQVLDGAGQKATLINTGSFKVLQDKTKG